MISHRKPMSIKNIPMRMMNVNAPITWKMKPIINRIIAAVFMASSAVR